MSTGFLLPRKANTLQRVGSSNGPKPPAPVRRSSSITSASIPLKLSDGVLGKPEQSQSLTSGAGEVRYSPNLRELKSHSALSSPQEMFNLSLRHVEINSPSENTSNGSSPRESSSASENSIVTDVSDSRARLIHDLNSTLQQSRPPPTAKKPSQNEPPTVPPRNTSKERNAQNHPKKEDKCSVENVLYGPTRTSSKEPRFLSKTRSEEHCSAENVLYGHCLKSERPSHTFSAKPVSSQDIQRQFHQKPRLKECLSQSDLLHCTKDWDRSYEHKNGNGNELPDNEKLLKRSFVVALNAKLAEHHRQNQGDSGQERSKWQMKNDKNYHTLSSGFYRLPPQICRESLMDQIKRGTRLRRVTSNDRSSPRFA